MNKNYVVYVHINKMNGKRYYGITSQRPEQRWKNGGGYKKQILGRAINKYGWDGFDHIIVARGLTEDEAKWLEIKMIAAHNTNNKRYGYNVTDGGDGTKGVSMSEEARRKLSALYKGKPSVRKGIHLSEETRRKISESHKGIRPSQETIQKRSGKNNYGARSVICITTKRMFFTAREGSDFYNLNNRSGITQCCKGNRKSVGKLSDGTKLVWRYLNYKHNKTYRIA